MTARKHTAADVHALLKAIASGDTDLTLRYDVSWDETYAGNVEFITPEGHIVVIFNDCDCYDYTDHVTFPDGQTVDFEEIYEGHADDLLTEGETATLYLIFKHAKHEPKKQTAPVDDGA